MSDMGRGFTIPVSASLSGRVTRTPSKNSNVDLRYHTRGASIHEVPAYSNDGALSIHFELKPDTLLYKDVTGLLYDVDPNFPAINTPEPIDISELRIRDRVSISKTITKEHCGMYIEAQLVHKNPYILTINNIATSPPFTERQGVSNSYYSKNEVTANKYGNSGVLPYQRGVRPYLFNLYRSFSPYTRSRMVKRNIKCIEYKDNKKTNYYINEYVFIASLEEFA